MTDHLGRRAGWQARFVVLRPIRHAPGMEFGRFADPCRADGGHGHERVECEPGGDPTSEPDKEQMLILLYERRLGMHLPSVTLSYHGQGVVLCCVRQCAPGRGLSAPEESVP